MICRAAGWEWVQVIRADGTGLEIISLDHPRCVAPIDLAIAYTEEGFDGTLAGLRAGITQGLRLRGAPGEYLLLA